MQGGVWFAACNPKANVVPILMDWFSARFNAQPFIIFDEAHGIAGVSHNGAWTLVKSDSLTLPEETTDEALSGRCLETLLRRRIHQRPLQPRIAP